MKTWKEKLTRHQFKKSKEGLLYQTKINRYKSRVASKGQHSNVTGNKRTIKKFVVPNDFRLFDNYEIVATFFNDVFSYLRAHICMRTEHNSFSIQFQMKNISKVCNSSIMYLIAIMNSFKNLGHKSIYFGGNLPDDKDCCEVFKDSGFFNYCNKHDMEVIKKPSNKIQIKHGNGTHDPEEFIELYRLLSNDKKKIRLLSPVLVEIIDNSVQHAYSMNNVFKGKEWYFFTEEKENKFEFILLDTGVGIPKTMKRNFKDFVNSIMSSNTESSILKSGFLGAFRTGTGEKNRGNGLPKIFDGVQSGVLSNMEILTEKAYCCIKKGGLIEANDKNNKFNGTLYRWEILKEDLM